MKKKYSKIFNSKNRAVSDIISTMLLISITIVGGVLVFSFFNSPGVTQSMDTEFVTGETSNRSVKLMGYDTRDGADLGGITVIDNDSTTDGFLKGSDGEFILLKIRNPNFNSVTIDRINVNEISHTLDIDSTETTLSSSTLPDAGKFRIVPFSQTTFIQSGLIKSGTDATIIVKLATTVPDIALAETIRVIIDSPDFEFIELLVPAGSTS